ncbi:unnamed protein product [Colias eurytheme]|nr:unnamed protein product [Colias eurytheme]
MIVEYTKVHDSGGVDGAARGGGSCSASRIVSGTSELLIIRIDGPRAARRTSDDRPRRHSIALSAPPATLLSIHADISPATLQCAHYLH